MALAIKPLPGGKLFDSLRQWIACVGCRISRIKSINRAGRHLSRRLSARSANIGHQLIRSRKSISFRNWNLGINIVCLPNFDVILHPFVTRSFVFLNPMGIVACGAPGASVLPPMEVAPSFVLYKGWTGGMLEVSDH